MRVVIIPNQKREERKNEREYIKERENLWGVINPKQKKGERKNEREYIMNVKICGEWLIGKRRKKKEKMKENRSGI